MADRWPGQVADPDKAAERHLAIRKPDTLLIYFFGDRSFGWFQPDTLAPFAEHFDQLSKVKVKKAVRHLACPPQTLNHLKHHGAARTGICTLRQCLM